MLPCSCRHISGNLAIKRGQKSLEFVGRGHLRHGCREIVLLSARLRFVTSDLLIQSNHGLQLLLFLSFSMNK